MIHKSKFNTTPLLEDQRSDAGRAQQNPAHKHTSTTTAHPAGVCRWRKEEIKQKLLKEVKREREAIWVSVEGQRWHSRPACSSSWSDTCSQGQYCSFRKRPCSRLEAAFPRKLRTEMKPTVQITGRDLRLVSNAMSWEQLIWKRRSKILIFRCMVTAIAGSQKAQSRWARKRDQALLWTTWCAQYPTKNTGHTEKFF